MTLEIQIMFLLSTLDTRVKIPPMDNYAMPDSNVLRNDPGQGKVSGRDIYIITDLLFEHQSTNVLC
jgi:hypothetical protein